MRRIVVILILLVSLVAGDVARAANNGTEDQPIAFRRTGKVERTWSVKVLTVYDDARNIDPSADWFNGWLDQNPPAKGTQILTLRVRIGNIGTQAGIPLATLALDLISDTGYVYDLGASCGTVPGGIGFGEQLDAGESIDTNVCWYVKTKHLPSLQLRVSPLSEDDSTAGTWFALRKTASTPTPTVMPTPGVGGLGLSRDAWEAIHGKEPAGQIVNYEGGIYSVLYSSDESDAIVLSVNWYPREPIASIDDARAIAETMLPADAGSAVSGIDSTGFVVGDYSSPTLAPIFPSDSPIWKGSPGSCYIAYHFDDNGSISWLEINIGHSQ